MPPKRKVLITSGITALLGLASLGIYLLYRYDPSTGGNFFPRCALHTLTGLHCPGCGSTRAAHDLLHGNIAGAVNHNLLLIMAIPFSIWYYLWDHLRPRLLQQARKPRPLLIWVLTGIVVVYSLTRNLPFEPFCRLAPH